MPISDVHHGVSFTGHLPFFKVSSSDFEEQGKFSYVRGFVLCKESSLKLTPHFERHEVGQGFWLYSHEKLAVERAGELGQMEVVFLGLGIFDKEEYIHTGENTAQILLNCFQRGGREAFLDSLCHLGGRWVVLLIADGEIQVFNDACGLKSVYYSKNNHVLGSHIDLVNMVADAPYAKLWEHCKNQKYVFTAGYIGNHTPYEGIELMTPNFCLTLSDFEEKRFYPYRKRRITNNYGRIKNELFCALRMQIKDLCSRGGDICFSLTSGCDSRVCYYAIREFKDRIYFFTEDRDRDVEKAESLSNSDGLNWLGTDTKDLHFDNNRLHDCFQRCITDKVFPYGSKYALRNNFFNFQMFGGKNYTHIHSNCAEAARGRFGAYEFDFLQETYSFEKFLDAYILSTYQWQSPENKALQEKLMHEDELLVAEVRKYFDHLCGEDIMELGYNPWDFMYIEQRTAGFLSQIHMLNDAAFDSISLTNCRSVMEILWQVPDVYIVRSNLLYNCILNEYDTENQAKIMGGDFRANAEDLKDENYGLVYGGYMMLEKMNSDEDRFQLVKRVLDINPTVKWAWDKVVSLGKATGRYWNPNGNLYETLSAGRVDIKNRGDKNKVEVVNVGDNPVRITYPRWFEDNTGNGCVIEGNKGKINVKLKCVGSGELRIYLRGCDVRGKSNERLPFKVVFTELKINGQQVLEENQSVWHDEAYLYSMDVEDGEFFDVEATWKHYQYFQDELNKLAMSMGLSFCENQ